MKKKALILGIGGQDGSYLAEILLKLGYEVHGLARRSSIYNLQRLMLIDRSDELIIHDGDLLDVGSVYGTLSEVIPDEVYNEADQDHVGFSFSAPHYSSAVTYGGAAVVLEGIRTICPQARFFQPTSATMFGLIPGPQNEQTPFAPASPYAVAKAAVHYLCQHYRREHNLFVSTGILYNHESPRRGPKYLLQHICRTAHAISMKATDVLTLGNLEIQVDIGFSGEYMLAAHRMLQLDKPDDFVIGTGTRYSIEELAIAALRRCDVSLDVIRDKRDAKILPCDLIANITKARTVLDFNPTYDALGMVEMLLDSLF